MNNRFKRDNAPELKYLVVGYNKCAFTQEGTRPDMLSESLVQHARENNYDGFFGCTHRVYVRLNWLKNNAISHLNTDLYTQQDLDNCHPTYKITENFSRATGLPCQAVSTPEDLCLNLCGAGFTEVIKPFEMNGATPYSEDHLPLCDFFKIKTKYVQLLQIANQISFAYPDHRILLDFIDDNKAICDNAKDLSNDPAWPENVKINIYRHLAENDHSPITPVLLQPELRLPAYQFVTPAASVREVNMFTRVTRSMTSANDELLQEVNRNANAM